jgi:hypothetical protein
VITKTGNPGLWWEEPYSGCCCIWDCICGLMTLTKKDGNKHWSLSQCKQQQKKQPMKNNKETRRAKPNGNPMYGFSSISIFLLCCYDSHFTWMNETLQRIGFSYKQEKWDIMCV